MTPLAFAGALLWWTSCALTAASLAYLLLAIAAVATHRCRRGCGWATQPEVTLLKPLCGYEIGLEAALASFFAQETSFPVRFVFGVTDPADPALAICRDVAACFPERRAEFVVDATVRGSNPKVSNLINMARRGLNEVVVISDSDIFIAPGALQAAVDALAPEDVGAATTLYRARPAIPGDPLRCFGAWNLDYWDLPMQMLYARLVPALEVTYGPLTAVRREALDRFGGLQVLADHICDDAELGRRVRGAGYEVVFTPVIAETLAGDASVGQLFRHELRWARTMRGIEPIGYGAMVVTHPGPLPLLLLLHPSMLAGAAVALPVLLRWALAILIARRFGKAEGLLKPTPLELWARDCACFAIWAAAFFVDRVDWRGRLLVLRRSVIVGASSNLDEKGA